MSGTKEKRALMTLDERRTADKAHKKDRQDKKRAQRRSHIEGVHASSCGCGRRLA
jgi:hypothetical protein